MRPSNEKRIYTNLLTKEKVKAINGYIEELESERQLVFEVLTGLHDDEVKEGTAFPVAWSELVKDAYNARCGLKAEGRLKVVIERLGQDLYSAKSNQEWANKRATDSEKAHREYVETTFKQMEEASTAREVLHLKKDEHLAVAVAELKKKVDSVDEELVKLRNAKRDFDLRVKQMKVQHQDVLASRTMAILMRVGMGGCAQEIRGFSEAMTRLQSSFGLGKVDKFTSAVGYALDKMVREDPFDGDDSEEED